MQTIWTRATQLGSACRCPQCASSIHGVSRRAAASATRRMPRYLTTSTLLYSGIFAAATTADAKSKKARREQWDQAIAEIKHELDQPGDVNSKAAAAAKHGNSKTQGGSVLPIFDADSQLNEFGSYLDSSILRRAKHWAPENTNGPLDPKYLAPQSLYASGPRKRKHLSKPWTEMKLERVRLCMDKLQLDILRELQETGLSQDAAQHVPVSYGEHISSSPEALHAHAQQKVGDFARLCKEKDVRLTGWQRSQADVPFSAYRMDEGGHFVERTRQLNQTLQILFRRRARGKIDRAELLAKIAHNVSACPTPPNIDTFNTLIVGFAHLREKRLYDCTTLALSHTRVRPNEVTLASIFRYDGETQDYTHFRHWLGRLRGQGIGLHAARPDIIINEDNKTRLVPRPDSTSGAVIQLPYPTAMVLNALVGGLLKFFGFNAALEACRDMGHEGWGLSMAGLRPLLQDCAERADWESGVTIWRKIQALKAKSRKRIRWGWNANVLQWKWRSEKVELPVYLAMLRLCKQCRQRDMFDRIAAETISAHSVGVPQLIKMMSEENKAAVEPDFEQFELRESEVPSADNPNEEPSLRAQASEVIEHFQQPAEVKQDPPRKQAQSRTVSQMVVPIMSCTTDTAMHQEQLHGLLPGDRHLDEYERYERPMSLNG